MFKKDNSYKTYKHILIAVLCFLQLKSADLADDLLIKAVVFVHKS